jgi:hypothetical protein
MVVQSVALLMFLVASFIELQTLETISVYLLWLALALAVLSGGKQVLNAIKSRRREERDPARIDLDNQQD